MTKALSINLRSKTKCFSCSLLLFVTDCIFFVVVTCAPILTPLPSPPPICIGIFREFGGARCVHNIVKYPQCRQHALMIIQQLVLSPSGDDDMGTLLGLMHSAPPMELQLKTDILRVNEVLLRTFTPKPLIPFFYTCF